MEKRYLVLWLEAPLQSWGADSKFGRRDTIQFPTKSGLFGMYLAALGAQGEQQQLLLELSEWPQTIYAYRKKTIPVSPFLMDFQMVGSGYRDSKDHPWERLLIPKTANGKSAVGGGSKMTYRYYLQDVCFGVIQELSQDLSERIGTALERPVYDLYLGRKNCVPTDFIFQGIFTSENDAVEFLKKKADEKMLDESFRVIEGQHEGNIIALNDVPIQFGIFKKYRDRYVTLIDLNE